LRLAVAVFAAVILGSVGAPAQTGPQAPAASPSVAIPNFWDPRQRAERPAEGAVPLIRFLTTEDFPPFSFLNDRGQLTGFNVDLARAICAELAIPCTIQARGFDDLVGHLTDKTADAVIAGLAITAASRQTLDFSEPYLRLPARFVARRPDASSAVTAAGLRGKTVAVVAGTAHEAYLKAMFADMTARPFATADAARGALKAGQTDLMFADGQQLAFWLQSDAAANCCAFAGGPYLDAHFFGEGYAIAVAKGSTTLKHALNAALQAIADKGVFGELYLRYFPVGFF
jgi:polar amino acid transport system substrate-binding protein